MTIASARAFIKNSMTDQELRRKLNHSKSLTELKQVLESEEFIFSDHELDEAYTSQLFSCQFEEDAQTLNQFKLWWDMLNNTMSDQSA